MKYGNGFWCLDAEGRHSPMPLLPRTMSFDYGDGTGDKGVFLLRTFAVEYRDPKTGIWYRFTIKGNETPILHENSFDWDWASIPKLCRALTCDKADYRVQVGSLFHDMGFCTHEVLPGIDLAFWNRFLFEVMEVYSVDARFDKVDRNSAKFALFDLRDRALRREVNIGVRIGGAFCWKKTEEEMRIYRALFMAETISDPDA